MELLWLILLLLALVALGLCIWQLRDTRSRLQAGEARAREAENDAAALAA